MIHKIRDTWKTLNTSIYTGNRLRANLKALTVISLFCAALGLALIVFDLAAGQRTMLIPAVICFASGVLCAVFAGVMKKRELAILVPTAFCIVMCTYYALSGIAQGSAIMWTLIVPIGVCYFVSVKYGIILSAYFTVLFILLFYTPLGNHIAAYYPYAFSSRFPIVYATMAIFTAISMIQYHRGALLEDEFAEKLTREVKKQTMVATERAAMLDKQIEDTVDTLAYTIDAKDRYTNGHSFRVSLYSVELAKELGWSEEEIKELEKEGLLHDIGKIGIPDSVLNKPGRLDDDEFAVIKSHTTTGGNILARSDSLFEASEVARYHHERYDGKGYPEGLAGEDIPLHARVVAIADAYDAMKSDRIYRKGLPDDVIREELIKGIGSQFDPEIVPVFLSLLDGHKLDNITAKSLSRL